MRGVQQIAKMYIIDNKRNILGLYAGQCKMAVYAYKVYRYALDLGDHHGYYDGLGKTVYRNGTESWETLPVWNGDWQGNGHGAACKRRIWQRTNAGEPNLPILARVPVTPSLLRKE